MFTKERWSKIGKVAGVVSGFMFVSITLFWMMFLNHTGINEVGAAYNSWTGKITTQHEPGWYRAQLHAGNCSALCSQRQAETAGRCGWEQQYLDDVLSGGFFRGISQPGAFRGGFGGVC